MKPLAINIDEVSSTELRAQAAKDKVHKVTEIGHNGKKGDAEVVVYDYAGVKVASTNGGCVWEESDPRAFQEFMESEGITLYGGSLRVATESGPLLPPPPVP